MPPFVQNLLSSELIFAGPVAAVLIISGVGLWLYRRHRIRQRAENRNRTGDVLGAAKMFEEIGDFARAASLYRTGADYLRAVQVYLALSDFDAAVEALRGANPSQIEAGAELLCCEKALDNRRAGSLAGVAKTAGLFGLAAKLFDKAGNTEEARAAWLQHARSLSTQGKPEEAAKIYERLGDLHAAATALLEFSQGESDSSNKQSLTSRAAALFCDVGDITSAADALAAGGNIDAGVELLLAKSNLVDAAQLLRWYGHYREAGELFEKAQDFARAARAYAHGGHIIQSAAMLEKAGDVVGAVRALIEANEHEAAAAVHLRCGAVKAAAEIYAGIGKLDHAIRVLVEADDIDSAVALLCRNNRSAQAAELLKNRGDLKRASALVTKEEEPLRKARQLEEHGEFEAAAQAFLDKGRPEEAKAALASLSKEEMSPFAILLLARASMATSDFREACDCYVRLLDSLPEGYRQADIIYGLAGAQEASGNVANAIVSLEHLVEIDPDYKDAQFKIANLKARLESPNEPNPVPLVPPAVSIPEEPPREDSISRRTGVPSRYLVERELGRGAMGVVYKAIDTQLQRAVAIKVLDKHAGADSRIREYFLREARAVAQLIHPNIVTLFDAGLEGTSPYLVMELVEGEDLRAWLYQYGIDMQQTAIYLAGAAYGLDYAHSRRIVHRDVKPENIMLSPNGSAKLMDFGVAHIMAESGDRRATVVGTPVYMSPEQIRGEPVAGYTDTYALGVVLFECLTGRPPFEPNGAFYHHVHTAPPDPRTIRPLIPAKLAELILRCLAKKPEERPASAKLLGDSLMAIAPSLEQLYGDKANSNVITPIPSSL